MGQLWNDRLRVRSREHQLGVIGAEMARHRPRAVRFVERFFAKADREGLHRPARRALHQCDDGRGIDAAGQERAERHVGDHLPLHRIGQEAVQLLDDLVFRPLIAPLLAVARDLCHIPIAP